MRLQRRSKKPVRQMPEEIVPELNKEEEPEKQQNTAKQKMKIVNPFQSIKPAQLFRQIVSNPNFGFQLMVILLTLTSGNIQMDRRIDGVTSTVDKIRSITEVVNSSMQSLKVASEAPKHIRRLLE
ncbi:MAG TPA: hypothetical protein VGL27_01845 [Negativicutes bacterium]